MKLSFCLNSWNSWNLVKFGDLSYYRPVIVVLAVEARGGKYRVFKFQFVWRNRKFSPVFCEMVSSFLSTSHFVPVLTPIGFIAQILVTPTVKWNVSEVLCTRFWTSSVWMLVGSAKATGFQAMIFGRILAGVGIGVSSGVVPLYISEVRNFSVDSMQVTSVVVVEARHHRAMAKMVGWNWTSDIIFERTGTIQITLLSRLV